MNIVSRDHKSAFNPRQSKMKAVIVNFGQRLGFESNTHICSSYRLARL